MDSPRLRENFVDTYKYLMDGSWGQSKEVGPGSFKWCSVTELDQEQWAQTGTQAVLYENKENIPFLEGDRALEQDTQKCYKS